MLGFYFWQVTRTSLDRVGVVTLCCTNQAIFGYCIRSIAALESTLGVLGIITLYNLERGGVKET